jgi:hypothetical protein
MMSVTTHVLGRLGPRIGQNDGVDDRSTGVQRMIPSSVGKADEVVCGAGWRASGLLSGGSGVGGRCRQATHQEECRRQRDCPSQWTYPLPAST